MKRRVMAKRRNKMLRLDKAVEKIQIAHMRHGVDGLNTPAGKRAMRKLEHAIDKLPAFNKQHKW